MSSVNFSSMQKFVGKFANVITKTDPFFGDYMEICLCLKINGNKLIFVNEDNQSFETESDKIVEVYPDFYISTKYDVGDLIGFEMAVPSEEHYKLITKYGSIINVHHWYCSVKYDIKLDDGSIVEGVLDDMFRPYKTLITQKDNELKYVNYILKYVQ
jgi:hypothetical protein